LRAVAFADFMALSATSPALTAAFFTVTVAAVRVALAASSKEGSAGSGVAGF
jgi:hypothetical protein